MLQYDLSDWIRDILNIEYPAKGTSLINHEQLYHYCGIMQRDHDQELVEDYASKLLLLAIIKINSILSNWLKPPWELKWNLKQFKFEWLPF